jgi:ribosomal protein L9
MNKLKQYEIDAIVSSIQNQIQETKRSERRNELDPAEAKIAELIKQEKEAYAVASALAKKRQELTQQLGEELNAFYCTTTNRFIAKMANPLGFIDIRNKVIISQINLDTNIEQVIKDIVTEYTK